MPLCSVCEYDRVRQRRALSASARKQKTRCCCHPYHGVFGYSCEEAQPMSSHQQFQCNFVLSIFFW